MESASEINPESQYPLIPFPAHLQAQAGKFIIDENTVLQSNEKEEKVNLLLREFAQQIKTATTYTLAITPEGSQKNAIVFRLDKSIENTEGYALSVQVDRIVLRAKNPAGLFYGVQTLRQLLPLEFEKPTSSPQISWAIPAVEIKDEPRFPYRGMHLDVARHFLKVDKVKKFIDQIAYHKFNHFHWHLTDDQGWRIEIKKYPKLTEVGGFRSGTLIGHYNDQPHQYDKKRYGGFYTQEDIKEVVQYAAERFITVIPEIELPGHAQAALAAYPELACENKNYSVWRIWGISTNIFCPTPATFDFLENVFDEVIPLFPGKYIHIGGDEAPKTKWQESAFCQRLMRQEGLENEMALQSYFIRRIEKHINSKGKQIIGWDEILEGGLAPNATVMSWRGIEGGIEAAKAGHDVIMTPTSHCYLDYYQSDHPDEPVAIGGFIPLEKIYQYDPIPDELSPSEAKHILGSQGNLWSEYLPNFEQVEYMAFPRVCALSEVVWSPQDQRDFDHFVERISFHTNRLAAMGINVANHLYDLSSSIQPKDGAVEVEIEALAKDGQIRYTLDGGEPTLQSSLYSNPIKVTTNQQIKAQSFLAEKPIGRSWQQNIRMHKAAGKKIVLKTLPHSKYSGGGPGSLINGANGNPERYGDAEWLGFDGKDLEAVIDLGKKETINTITFRFFIGEGQWIYLPKSIQVFTSEDGLDFIEKRRSKTIEGDQKLVKHVIALDAVQSRYLKVVAENYGIIPKGRQGEGNESWLFVDEIVVD